VLHLERAGDLDESSAADPEGEVAGIAAGRLHSAAVRLPQGLDERLVAGILPTGSNRIALPRRSEGLAALVVKFRSYAFQKDCPRSVRSRSLSPGARLLWGRRGVKEGQA
jgi:hypothetical protein